MKHTISLLLLCLPAVTNAASLVNLGFSSLPSSQGFSYSQSGPHSDDSEATQFAVDGTFLTQSTVGKGQGFSTPGYAEYRKVFTTAETLGATNFRFEMTASVTAHENTRQDFSYGAFSQSIYINNEGMYLGIKPNELHFNGSYFTPVGFDGTLMHDYRVDVDLVTNQAELFLDGVSVRTVAASNFTGNYLRFGDGTGTGNSDGQISRLTLTTNVPEPTSFGLLSMAALAFGIRRKR